MKWLSIEGAVDTEFFCVLAHPICLLVILSDSNEGTVWKNFIAVWNWNIIMLLLMLFCVRPTLFICLSVWMYDLICWTAVSKPDRNCNRMTKMLCICCGFEAHWLIVCEGYEGYSVSFKEFKGAIETKS